MNRRSSAGILIVVALVGPSLGHADAAPIEQGRSASTTLTLHPRKDVTVDVSVRAVRNAGGDRIFVDTRECSAYGCSTSPLFAAALPKAAFAVDPTATKATLSMTLDGLVLSITWTPGAAGVAMNTGSFSGRDTGGAGYADYMGKPATVRASLGDLSCKGNGAVTDGIDYSLPTGADGTEPLTELKVSPAPMTC